MKCIRAILALLCLFVAAIAAAQNPSARTTIQSTLGFEDSREGALTGWNVYPAGAATADGAISHGGKWSAKLQLHASDKERFVMIGRTLPVDFKGGEVELRGYMRLQDVADFAGLWMRLDGDGQTFAFDNMQSQRVNGARDWMQYHITLPLRAGAEQLTFGVLVSGAGVVWADDMELFVDGKPIALAESNPLVVAKNVDHEFDAGSRIQLSALTPTQVENLATLAQVWGFLKYHHAVVTGGEFRWDYELFRMLPSVLAAKDAASANAVLSAWIKRLDAIKAHAAAPPLLDDKLALRPPLHWIHDRAKLGDDLSRALEEVYAKRSERQYYVSLGEGVSNPVFLHESAYANAPLPDSGYQLLALFRWWNMQQYWSPYRETAGADWSAVLREFIPRMALAKSKTEYQLALFALVANANDTHANLWGALYVLPPTGECYLPATVRFVGDKAVVWRVDEGEKQLRAGDVIEALGDASVKNLVDQLRPMYAASNESARLRNMASLLTRGACGPVVARIVRSGVVITAPLERVKREEFFFTHDLPGAAFQVLRPDIAYIKLSNIKTADIDKYIEQAQSTRALIIDIRNYPAEFVPDALGGHLVDKPTPFVSFTVPDLANPGAFTYVDRAPILPLAPRFVGKVVVLVDESTQSSAEFTAMAMRASPHAIVLGSTTAGADGNISDIPLPGGQNTMLSGIGVYYPDHRPTQRVGVALDVVATPSIEDFAAGRDSVLDKAIEWIGASDR